jgi:hypothetical protein
VNAIARRDSVDDDTALFAPLTQKVTENACTNEQIIDGEEETSNSWNFQTHVDISSNSKNFIQLLPKIYKSVISHGKYRPNNEASGGSFQISNQSKIWKARLFGVDTNGVLYRRTEVLVGSSHIELINSSYIWLVVVTKSDGKLSTVNLNDDYGLLVNLKSHQTTNFTPVEDFTWSPLKTLSRYSHLKHFNSYTGKTKEKSGTICENDTKIQQIIRITD